MSETTIPTKEISPAPENPSNQAQKEAVDVQDSNEQAAEAKVEQAEVAADQVQEGSANGDEQPQTTNAARNAENIVVASALEGGRETSNKILYVGSLHKSVSEDSIKELFAVAGPDSIQSVKLLNDKNKIGFNYAFIEFDNNDSATAALTQLNGTVLASAELKINWAFQSSNVISNSDQNGGYSDPMFNIFVGDLSPEVDDEALNKAFQKFGSLKSARVMWDMQTSRSRGYGFVNFSEQQDAEEALRTMNGEWICGRAIRCNWASHKQVQNSQNNAQPQYGVRRRFNSNNNSHNNNHNNHNNNNNSNNNNIGNGHNGHKFNGYRSYNNTPQFEQGEQFQSQDPNILIQQLQNHGQHQQHQQQQRLQQQLQQQHESINGQQYPSNENLPEADFHALQHEQENNNNNGNNSVMPPSNMPVMSPQSYDIVLRQTPSWQTTVYLGNIAHFTQQGDLIPLLQNFGFIVDFKFHPERGCAFVKYDTHERAALAIVQLAGFNVNGRPLKCGWGKDRPPMNHQFNNFRGPLPQMYQRQ
ncbi:nuclear and cytoplasmic polyadenylated RNA-binding protein Pub1p [[Candida] railenensis]|uniref:Nuclear and cytoplasmic polyadenylated RNA-binding protein Pub1p n=1 Tax=[Candida] railenensis TaxID=45579 RepID=A0A9P0QRL3_9ASCO|nr:nuclear and cytoplasmic polyadenylated RNA-binding protein Pub1p [[Candida] railenensis]